MLFFSQGLFKIHLVGNFFLPVVENSLGPITFLINFRQQKFLWCNHHSISIRYQKYLIIKLIKIPNLAWSPIFFCNLSGPVSSSGSVERALILLSLPVLCFRPSPHLSHQGVLSHPIRHEWEGRKCESRKVLTWWVFLLSWLCAPQTCSVFKADCLSGGWFHVFFREDLLLEVPLIQLRQALQFGLLELCRILSVCSCFFASMSCPPG